MFNIFKRKKGGKSGPQFAYHWKNNGSLPLTARDILEGDAQAFAIRDGDFIHVDTVAHDERLSIMKFLLMNGIVACPNPDCDCAADAMAKLKPNAKVIEVTISENA